MALNIVAGDDIIIGRKEKDVIEYGKRGVGFIGRVIISKGVEPVLGRRILMDLASSHVVLVLGKRGYGKSYTLGVIIEEFFDLPYSVRSRTSVIVVDTMGIFWTMKYPNEEQKGLLESWGLSPKRFDPEVLVPKGSLPFYMEHGIPVDGFFALNPQDMGIEEWLAIFGLTMEDEAGVVLASAVSEMDGQYTIDDLINAVEKVKAEEHIKQSVIMRLRSVKAMEVIDPNAKRAVEYATPGKITILDVSTLRHAYGTQSLQEVIVAILGKHLLEERMKYRKVEEKADTSKMPLVWMIIDEAHLFLPSDRKSLSGAVLSDWIRIGRQPGLSLVLATQRVDKLHEDALTQSDIMISHRITSGLDVKALSKIKPTYVAESFDKHVRSLPHTRGLAVVLDDITERLWVIRVRPRKSKHGGETAKALTKL